MNEQRVVERDVFAEKAQGPQGETLSERSKIHIGTCGTPVRPYLNAANPVTSMPVMSR